MDEEGLTILGIDLFHPSTWRRRGTFGSSSSLPRCSRWRCWRTGGSQRRSYSRWSGRQGKRWWGRWVQVPARTTMWLLLVDPSKKFQLQGKQKTTKMAIRRRAGKTMSKRSRNPGVAWGWEFFTFIQIRLILRNILSFWKIDILGFDAICKLHCRRYRSSIDPNSKVKPTG